MDEKIEEIIKAIERDREYLLGLKNNCIALSDKEVNDCQNYVYDRIINIIREHEEDEYSLEDDNDDYCYECGSCGDDYYYNEETGQLESNCDNCSHNRLNWED